MCLRRVPLACGAEPSKRQVSDHGKRQGGPGSLAKMERIPGQQGLDGPSYAQLLDGLLQQHNGNAGEYIADLPQPVRDVLAAIRQHSSILDDCQDEMLIWFKQLYLQPLRW